MHYISSSFDFSFYPQHFESLLTPITFIKKILILSTLVPSRLSRVHHIALYSGSTHELNTSADKPSLTLPMLFREVWSLVFLQVIVWDSILRGRR